MAAGVSGIFYTCIKQTKIPANRVCVRLSGIFVEFLYRSVCGIHYGAVMQNSCSACKQCATGYARKFPPEEFVLGDTNAALWIVGLNPAQPDSKYAEPQTTDDLAKYFDDPKRVHPYFSAFAKVLPALHTGLLIRNGVAHTDLVKCPTEQNHSKTDAATWKTVEHACGVRYLLKQLRHAKPRLILCNGAKVSDFVTKHILPPPDTAERQSSYVASLEGQPVTVVRSGFIQRLDRFSQQRLGEEIQKVWIKNDGLREH
jgi:uracil-DNA glycosylase